MACVFCNNDNFRPFYTIEGWHIERCQECALVQLNPLPDGETLEALYNEGYYENASSSQGYDDYAAQKEEYRATFRREVQDFSAYFPSGRVLDVGCGFGDFVTAALERGYDAYGVDLSTEATAIGAKENPERVFRGTLDDTPELDEGSFDLIFCSHTIEHVLDPCAFIATVRRFLKPGGYAVLLTPNIGSALARLSGRRWISFKVPEHITYFSPETISALCTRAGFQVVRTETSYQCYRIPFVASKLRALFDPVSRLLPPVENATIFQDRLVRINNGSMRVIARRPLGD